MDPGCAGIGAGVRGVAVLALALLLAQPPFAAPTFATSIAQDSPPWRRAFEAGRQAAAAGDAAAARAHFLNAWRARPAGADGAAVLDGLVDAAPVASGERALWALTRLESEAAGASRRVDARLAQALGPLAKGAPALVAARAAAAEELTRFAAEARRSKQSEDALLVHWAARALEIACQSSPALAASTQPEVERNRRPFEEMALSGRGARTLADALAASARDASAHGEDDVALRAARILVGLGAQLECDELRGEAPRGLEGLSKTGAQIAAAARERLAGRRGPPYTLAELEALTPDERLAFDARYRDAGLPARGLSPNGRYVIETHCGYETLLGTMRTVELHHARLVNWCGRDPFQGQMGTVRIVPETFGLECEGNPLWWAGGFQSGDLTVLRFAFSDIEGLGRGLTHELTHRFDGALSPGMPAWAVEGRAVWTSTAYGASRDPAFVEGYGTGGAMQDAALRGYADAKKLEDLLAGANERYRDNYTAGYAMWLYLATWQVEGRALFAPRVPAWMAGSKTAKDALGWFQKTFVDGQDGRPADWPAFLTGWRAWLDGWWWQHPAPWTARYALALPPAEPSDAVLDARTWPNSVARAEPVFGLGHAREAARLFVERGRRDDALRAWTWSLGVDGRAPATDAECAALLRAAGRNVAAWVLDPQSPAPASSAAAARDGGARTPAPFAERLPRTRALIDAWAAAAQSASELPLARAALWAERERLAAHLGLPPLAPLDAATTAGLDARAPPLDAGPWDAASTGFGEEQLAGYDERRAPGLWFVDARDDLHVGRERPRDASGEQDRAAAVRDACALCTAWMPPGRWRVRATVHFTTTYASGALVFGWQRFDRYARVTFAAGDYLYSIGTHDTSQDSGLFGWSLGGRFEREGPLSLRAGGSREFGAGRSSFDLDLLVDGPDALLSIDGQLAARYRTPDGSALEGRVGFATDTGAVRVSEFTLERLDRARALGLADEVPDALDLARPARPDFRDLLGRALRGLAPSPRGRLVVWLSAADEDVGGADGAAGDAAGADPRRAQAQAFLRSQALHAAGEAERLLTRLEADVPLCVLLPACQAGEDREAWKQALQAELTRDFEIETYACAEPDASGDDGARADTGRDSFLFVDAAGVVRERQMPVADATDEMRRWIAIHRLADRAQGTATDGPAGAGTDSGSPPR